MPIIFATKTKSEYKEAVKFFLGHDIKIEAHPLPPRIQRNNIDEYVASIHKKYHHTSKRILLGVKGKSSYTLHVFNGKKYEKISGHGKGPELNSLSHYILKYHTYPLNKITCREDSEELRIFTTPEGNLSFHISPAKWIKTNTFFTYLPQKLYRRLLNFILNERGLFLKVWKLNAQKIYWNAPLNGGLPVISKSEVIHEGAFMLHDIHHFVFKDPVFTAKENKREIQAYVAYRMMSEAWTMILTDMMAVAHAKLDKRRYNTSKRRIFPLFKSISLPEDSLATLRNLLYANSIFALYGDDSEYRKLGVSEEALENFKEKYSIFFSVDMMWNYQNLKEVITHARKQKTLLNYCSILPKEIHAFNTGTLCTTISLPNGFLSFDKLFSLFWDQYFSVVTYRKTFSPPPFQFFPFSGIKNIDFL